VVIVIMALDHVRDYLLAGSLQNPMDDPNGVRVAGRWNRTCPISSRPWQRRPGNASRPSLSIIDEVQYLSHQELAALIVGN
jgi:hypothetical protein